MREPDPEPVAEPALTFAGPLEAALRHPILTLLPLVALTAAAAVLGVTRDPTYTAEARISVGRVDVPAYALQGMTIGNATLASELLTERSVAPSRRRCRRQRRRASPPPSARSNLSRVADPPATLIRVEADRAPTRRTSVRLANSELARPDQLRRGPQPPASRTNVTLMR